MDIIDDKQKNPKVANWFEDAKICDLIKDKTSGVQPIQGYTYFTNTTITDPPPSLANGTFILKTLIGESENLLLKNPFDDFIFFFNGTENSYVKYPPSTPYQDSTYLPDKMKLVWDNQALPDNNKFT